MKFVPVPATEYAAWADKARPIIADMLASDQWTVADLEAEILSRDRQLWLAVDGDDVAAVCLTCVGNDRLKSVIVTHCGGFGMHGWAHMIEMIAAWGREIGSGRLEVVSRPGWERVLAPYGLKKSHVVLEKRL